MDWFLVFISSVCFVSILLYLDLLGRARALNSVPVKVLRVIRAPGISDHWKEKVLPSYALQLLTQSLSLFGLLLVALLPFGVSSVISTLFHGHFISLVSSPLGIMASTAFAIGFAMVLPKKTSEDYGTGARLLHQLVLGNSFLGETLFDIEKSLHGKGARDVSTEKHVFVAGLARAGTTILMRTLYEKGDFYSLTYRDMPFILAPNSWRRCSHLFSKEGKKQERAHGDGIEVDYDSPEALEEVFWRTFCGDDYIRQDSLVPMEAGRGTLKDFTSFVSLILKPAPGKRYLSKNNNNILRLDSICKAFPNGVVIVPFRDPLQQAWSLRSQHRKFAGDNDPFTRKYMTWLAHHEFGADHRPFVFHRESGGGADAEQLNYWLQLWIDTYTYLLDTMPPQAVLLSYEMLCEDTTRVWSELSLKVGLDSACDDSTFTWSHRNIDEDVSPQLLAQAAKLYETLTRRSLGGGGLSESSAL